VTLNELPGEIIPFSLYSYLLLQVKYLVLKAFVDRRGAFLLKQSPKYLCAQNIVSNLGVYKSERIQRANFK
jgi:hypothetical protein